MSQSYINSVSLIKPFALVLKMIVYINSLKKGNMPVFLNCKREDMEIPFYASFKKASYTIEAAIIMPLFISLMVFGMFIFRVLQVQSGIQQSIDFASRTMAVTLGNVANTGESNEDVNPNEQDPSVSGELSEGGLIAGTIAVAGVEVVKNKVPLEFIDGGALGLNFLESEAEGNYIDAAGNKYIPAPQGGFYDEAGGYYDVSGNYYPPAAPAPSSSTSAPRPCSPATT